MLVNYLGVLVEPNVKLTGEIILWLKTLADQVAYNSLLGSLTNSRGWIGLFQNTSSPNYSEPKGGWEWIDGTTLDYDAATDTWSGYTKSGNQMIFNLETK